MKNQILLSFILLLGSFVLHLNSFCQITRGAQPAELYLSTDWYMDNYGHIHYGIFRSVDNCATITLQYESSTASPPDEMDVGWVLGDATIGASYNIGGNELWVSLNYGENWEFREDYPDYTRYWGGEHEGTIYKGGWGLLQKSNDYALNFEIVSDPPNCPISDIGVNEGEFYGIDGNAGEEFFLYHTNDYAINYTEIGIDSSVAFWAPSGIWPKISRGSNLGEIYLVSWWLDSNYKIFYSADSGYTWIEQFESEYIDVYYWRVAYTAGKEPGSFYVMRSRINDAGDHIWLYIDYSNDYGETFTTYFHDLDSTITKISTSKLENIQLSNFPNPFVSKTTFKYNLPKNCEDPVLNILNINGIMIRQFDISRRNSHIWDGRDKNGHNLSNGVYLYNISYGDYYSPLNKLLIIR